MGKAILLFCLFWIAFSGRAQTTLPLEEMASDSTYAWNNLYRNSLYGELLGNSFFGATANYEKLFPLNSRKKVTFALRGGLGVSYSWFGPMYLVVPAELTFYGGRQFVKPEFGVGFTLLKDMSYPGMGVLNLMRLGLRFQKTGSHFFGRFGVSCWITGTNPEALDLRIYPIPGVSLGYSFGKKKSN